MRERRPGLKVQRAVNELGHHVRRSVEDVLVGGGRCGAPGVLVHAVTIADAPPGVTRSERGQPRAPWTRSWMKRSFSMVPGVSAKG